MKLNFSLLSIAAAAALLAAPAVHAKPFKWASQGEISTWDIHSQNNALQNGLHANVYESVREPGVLQQQDLRGGAGAGNLMEGNQPHADPL